MGREAAVDSLRAPSDLLSSAGQALRPQSASRVLRALEARTSCVAHATFPTIHNHRRHVSDTFARRFVGIVASFGVRQAQGPRRSPDIVGRKHRIAGQELVAARQTGLCSPVLAGFFGYSSTFEETPGRPGFPVGVSAGQGVACLRSTRHGTLSGRAPTLPGPAPASHDALAPMSPRPARRSLRFSGRNCSKNQIASRF